MTVQDQQSHKNAAKDGRLTIPAATVGALSWSPSTTVYITADEHALIITDKEQGGRQNHTLTIHRRGAIILAPFILRKANIDGREMYAIEVLKSESDGESLRISAA